MRLSNFAYFSCCVLQRQGDNYIGQPREADGGVRYKSGEPRG